MLNTEELVVKQTQDMLTERREQYNALTWPEPKLQDMRNKQLRAILAHAKSHSPWYKKKLTHIDVENFTEQQLPEIPVINKETLMANWDEIVTDRRLSLTLVEKHIENMSHDGDTLYLLDRYHVLATSGSSGKRGVFIYNWDEWNKYNLYIKRYRLYNHDRSLIFEPTKKLKIAFVVVSNTVYAMYSLSKSFKINGLETYHFPITLPMKTIVSGLNQTQADILQGTPTTIHKLCGEASEGRLNIQPKVIIVGGESLYSPIRELINNTWPNANIFNTFASSEGLIGVNCHANSSEMHLNNDACIIEPVDEWNHSVAKGIKPHKLYLTNLYNHTLPLIRYEFSDQLLFLDKTCECGVKHQLIAEPQGRPEFDFIYSGNIFVHHLLFVTPLLHEKNIHEYQVIQTKNGADIKILTRGNVDKDRLQNKFCSELSKLGLSTPIINLIEVSKFDYPVSGKLRRFLKI